MQTIHVLMTLASLGGAYGIAAVGERLMERYGRAPCR
jgi:hypothetical protein